MNTKRFAGLALAICMLLAVFLFPAASHAQTDKLQTDLAELKTRLAQTHEDERKELEQAKDQITTTINGLRAEVQSLSARESEAQKQFEAAKQQQDSLKKQLDDLNAARNAYANRWTPFVEKAQTNATTALVAATRFHADYLTAAAKLINDAIRQRHLSIPPVPSDGKYTDKIDDGPAVRTGTISVGDNTISITERRIATEFEGEIFQSAEVVQNVGNWIVHSRVGEIMPSKDGVLNVITQVSTRPTGNEIRFRQFVRFPKELDDVRVRQSFSMMYWRFSRDMRPYDAAAQTAQDQLTTAENGLKSDLQKWDSQYGARLQTTQEQLSGSDSQVKDLNHKLSAIQSERATKEAALNKPLPEQVAELQQQVRAKHANTRRSLDEQIESLQARLKLASENVRPRPETGTSASPSTASERPGEDRMQPSPRPETPNTLPRVAQRTRKAGPKIKGFQIGASIDKACEEFNEKYSQQVFGRAKVVREGETFVLAPEKRLTQEDMQRIMQSLHPELSNTNTSEQDDISAAIKTLRGLTTLMPIGEALIFNNRNLMPSVTANSAGEIIAFEFCVVHIQLLFGKATSLSGQDFAQEFARAYGIERMEFFVEENNSVGNVPIASGWKYKDSEVVVKVYSDKRIVVQKLETRGRTGFD